MSKQKAGLELAKLNFQFYLAGVPHIALLKRPTNRVSVSAHNGLLGVA